jgi:oligopeptide transport system substrate-binding protein
MRAAVPALRITGSILLAAAALTACSGGGDPRPTTSTRPPGQIVEGGTMRLGLGGPVQPDPLAANLGSPTDMLVLDLLHDGLTRVDGDGAPVPALAASWTPDATFTTWVFKLNPGATFTSGRPVTSADVQASLEHIAKAGDTSLAALRLETITGFRAFVDGTAEHLAGVTAPDAATVQIALDTPMSVLPVILASPVFGIVDTHSLAASTRGDLAHLDLAGGWAVRSSKPHVVTLERRGPQKGHLHAVQLRSYSSSNAAYDAFDHERVDWALVPVDRYGAAIDRYGHAAFAPFHAELFFGLRVTSPNLANAELRKAIATAIDRKAIVRAVYPDLAAPLARVVPDGVPGYDPALCADCGYDHDPAKAKAILAAAFPNGQIPTVAIDFDQSPPQAEMARIVAHDLDLVGIPSQLRPKPLEEYKAFVVSGAQELFSFGWIGGYASSDAYLAPLFGSAANDNLTAYRSDAVDAGLAAARATADAAGAARQWSGVERQVLADAVVVPIAQFRTQAVLGERVRGFEHAVDGSVDWSAVWVTDGA